MTRHIYRCPLRWADMDIYGVVNNVQFLRYLEEARLNFMAPLETVDGEGTLFRGDPVIVRHTIEYKRPLVHRRQPVDIETWVGQLQSATVSIEYQVKDGNEVYATASTVIAPFNHAAGRTRRWTAAERTFFEKYLEGSEGV